VFPGGKKILGVEKGGGGDKVEEGLEKSRGMVAQL